MPIYEYECEACGYQLEAIQKMSDNALTECPSCGQPTLKKLVSAAGFRLSGSGWYETDFKKSSKRNIAEKESREPSDAKKSKSSEKKKTTGTEKSSTTKKSVTGSS